MLHKQRNDQRKKHLVEHKMRPLTKNWYWDGYDCYHSGCHNHQLTACKVIDNKCHYCVEELPDAIKMLLNLNKLNGDQTFSVQRLMEEKFQEVAENFEKKFFLGIGQAYINDILAD